VKQQGDQNDFATYIQVPEIHTSKLMNWGYEDFKNVYH